MGDGLAGRSYRRAGRCRRFVVGAARVVRRRASRAVGCGRPSMAGKAMPADRRAGEALFRRPHRHSSAAHRLLIRRRPVMYSLRIRYVFVAHPPLDRRAAFARRTQPPRGRRERSRVVANQHEHALRAMHADLHGLLDVGGARGPGDHVHRARQRRDRRAHARPRVLHRRDDRAAVHEHDVRGGDEVQRRRRRARRQAHDAARLRDRRERRRDADEPVAAQIDAGQRAMRAPRQRVERRGDDERRIGKPRVAQIGIDGRGRAGGRRDMRARRRHLLRLRDEARDEIDVAERNRRVPRGGRRGGKRGVRGERGIRIRRRGRTRALRLHRRRKLRGKPRALAAERRADTAENVVARAHRRTSG
ncbi:hypothetical protein DM77_2493 [Burkholderia mallei]|nr:hypothetical protein DM77_2493 [Burkholderia mallei]